MPVTTTGLLQADVIVITEPTPYVPLAVGRGDAGDRRSRGVDDDVLLCASEPADARGRQGEDGGVGVGDAVSTIVPPLRVSAVVEASSSGWRSWPAATV